MWPAQVLLVLIAVAAVGLLLSRVRTGGRWAAAVLAALWLWMGVVYHLAFFRRINPAAIVFGAAFLLQGLLFAQVALGAGLPRATPRGPRGALAAGLLAYALLVYPGLAWLLGHRFPAMPTFGLPCPTTIFTWGMLLLAPARPPLALMVIPSLWALVGVAAALGLGIWEDLGLAVAGGSGVIAATRMPVRTEVAV